MAEKKEKKGNDRLVNVLLSVLLVVLLVPTYILSLLASSLGVSWAVGVELAIIIPSLAADHYSGTIQEGKYRRYIRLAAVVFFAIALNISAAVFQLYLDPLLSFMALIICGSLSLLLIFEALILLRLYRKKEEGRTETEPSCQASDDEKGEDTQGPMGG